MSILPKQSDYACFIDADAMFTTYNYGKQLEDIIKLYPNIACFTAKTNRIACVLQIQHGVNINNNDMKYHRDIGKSIQESNYAKCRDITDFNNATELMSGVLMLVQKRAWKKIGGFSEKGILNIDNLFHRALKNNNKKIYLMKGVYVYHWYRYPNFRDKSHLL
jgi:GT2 family glycosyltransferase